jgi:hypothetical protein
VEGSFRRHDRVRHLSCLSSMVFPHGLLTDSSTETDYWCAQRGLSRNEVSLRSGQGCLDALLSQYRAVAVDAVRDVAQRLDEEGWRLRFSPAWTLWRDGTVQVFSS